MDERWEKTGLRASSIHTGNVVTSLITVTIYSVDRELVRKGQLYGKIKCRQLSQDSVLSHTNV